MSTRERSWGSVIVGFHFTSTHSFSLSFYIPVSGVVYGSASVIPECIEFMQDGVACRFQRTVRVFLYETTIIVISAAILEFQFLFCRSLDGSISFASCYY